MINFPSNEPFVNNIANSYVSVFVYKTDEIRNIRDVKLNDIDRVNPIWYASLTTEQQQELQTYRQALLDVPQQSGFPQSVSWPTAPSWL